MVGTPLRLAAPTRTVTAQEPIGIGIYGLPIFADFLLVGAPGFPAGLATMVKWQQSPGSVDEQFPALVQCIPACYPCPTVIVADGGGQRPGALAWLRGQCQGKLLAVYTLVEFLGWANRQLETDDLLDDCLCSMRALRGKRVIVHPFTICAQPCLCATTMGGVGVQLLAPAGARGTPESGVTECRRVAYRHGVGDHRTAQHAEPPRARRICPGARHLQRHRHRSRCPVRGQTPGSRVARIQSRHWARCGSGAYAEKHAVPVLPLNISTHHVER